MKEQKILCTCSDEDFELLNLAEQKVEGGDELLQPAASSMVEV